MSLHELEDLVSCILDFQANMLRVTHKKKMTPVDPDAYPSQAASLEEIWDMANLDLAVDEGGEICKWRSLGFETEDMLHEFHESGVLGLECLVGVLGFNLPFHHLTVNSQRKFVGGDPEFALVRSFGLPLYIAAQLKPLRS